MKEEGKEHKTVNPGLSQVQVSIQPCSDSNSMVDVVFLTDTTAFSAIPYKSGRISILQSPWKKMGFPCLGIAARVFRQVNFFSKRHLIVLSIVSYFYSQGIFLKIDQVRVKKISSRTHNFLQDRDPPLVFCGRRVRKQHSRKCVSQTDAT